MDGLFSTEGTFSTLSADVEGNGAHLSLESACGASDCVRSASDERKLLLCLDNEVQLYLYSK